MIKKQSLLLLAIILGYSTSTLAAVFKPGTEYQVCFSPYQDCTGEIVAFIDSAKRSVFVQAYSFTSDPIAKALFRAFRRGVKVKIIFDKSQFKGDYYSSAKYLIPKGIPSWEDYRLNIAHNKVIIVDKSAVQTGSFNYTVSAQKYNAENILIIHSKVLAKKYLANWYRRQAVSKAVFSYPHHRKSRKNRRWKRY